MSRSNISTFLKLFYGNNYFRLYECKCNTLETWASFWCWWYGRKDFGEILIEMKFNRMDFIWEFGFYYPEGREKK